MCGSDLCVLRRWGSVTVHRRWGDVWIGGRIGQRWKENSSWVFLKLSDRTIMKDQRWGELGMTGVGPNRSLVRWLDRRLVHGWIGVCFAHWIGVSFADRCFVRSLDRRLVHSLIGVWIVLSLAHSLFWFAEFFLSLALSLSFARGRKQFEGKMNL